MTNPYRPPEIPEDADLSVANMSGEIPTQREVGFSLPIVIAFLCVVALAAYYLHYVRERPAIATSSGNAKATAERVPALRS